MLAILVYARVAARVLNGTALVRTAMSGLL